MDRRGGDNVREGKGLDVRTAGGFSLFAMETLFSHAGM